MAQEVEFTCQDCGATVIQIDYGMVNDNTPPVCMTCQWLRNIEDPEDRENLRQFLQKTGAIDVQ